MINQSLKGRENMNVVGIIVEYNPFHFGHLYHINQTQLKTNADVVIAVMSSHFSQRGEPIIKNKWDRCQTALEHGVDIVIELPFIYGVHSADFFARHAIYLLDQLKCTQVCFGSETNDIEQLHQLAHMNEDIKKQPNISLNARSEHQKLHANDILGASYIKAINYHKSDMEACTIQRTNGFHDLDTSNTHASATAIRHCVKHGLEYNTLTPMRDLEYRDLNDYLDMIRLQFMCHRKAIKDTIHCVEGIDNLIEKHIFKVGSVDELIDICSNKKYTKVRIARVLNHILCMSDKQLLIDYPTVPYIRVLGSTANGISYLSTIKKKLNLPLITTISNFSHPILDFECRVSKIWSLKNHSIIDDYQHPIIII